MTDWIEEFSKDLAEWQKNKLISKYPLVTREDLERDGIIIYGGSTIGNGITSILMDSGIIPKWIVDGNAALNGSKFRGVSIKPIESLLGGGFVLLASTHIREMEETCERLGVSRYILPFAVTPVISLPCAIGETMCVDLNKEKLISALALMEDEKSRLVMRQFVKYLYVYDNDFSRVSDPVEYFPDDLAGKIDYGKFVDCGAFNGDTLQTYINKSDSYSHREYFGFEPDTENFCELEKVAETARACGIEVRLFKAGVGKTNCIVNTIGFGVGTTVNARGHNKTEIRSIDDALKSSKPTCIKADVEGSEMDLLLGAEKTIRTHRPTLIISLYHKLKDIYEIPMWVDSLNLGYKIYLRHAPKVFSDTAMYAIAE